MKTSIILIAALILNTTLLLAEPVSDLLKSISVWPFVILEILLFVGYYLNLTLRDFRKVTKPDFTNLKIFVVKGSKEIKTDTRS
ncbi:hypothetical protein [Maribacter halichondriae]|uniref:hypothetical protein n=1 Tax=Maribacter halichondriae TaxID=2980554 RepID=UPI00235A109C|nr:hypothetical protein [Maribacter sp. Hal144]